MSSGIPVVVLRTYTSEENNLCLPIHVVVFRSARLVVKTDSAETKAKTKTTTKSIKTKTRRVKTKPKTEQSRPRSRPAKKQILNKTRHCVTQIELHKPGQMQFSILVLTNAIYKYVLH